jgi:hypothetical protein
MSKLILAWRPKTYHAALLRLEFLSAPWSPERDRRTPETRIGGQG